MSLYNAEIIDVIMAFGFIPFALWLFCQYRSRSTFLNYYRKSAKTLEQENSSTHYFHHKKPQWVTDKVIYLKALNPDYGCRKIAYTFNRLYRHKNQSVSKSFVYDKLKQHQYQILLLRRQIKRKLPVNVPKNQKWGMDLTTVTDITGERHQILVTIDYGTRKCLSFKTIPSKHTRTIIWTLLKTIGQYGNPRYLKTDNEAVFKSWRFNLFLRLLSIRHQYSDIASPWQNGRVERLIGTFKERVKKLMVQDNTVLNSLLSEFVFWYNDIRPHNHLRGKTPGEVWSSTLRNQRYKYWQGWEGLLTGFKPI